MNTSTAETRDQKTLPMEQDVEAEISKLAKQDSPQLGETSGERLRSSVARLTSKSIDDLQGLTSELQKMQEFLRTEVDSVQRQIEVALAGIDIIVETIGPWKSTAVSLGPRNDARVVVRAGPAANIETPQSRRVGGNG